MPPPGNNVPVRISEVTWRPRPGGTATAPVAERLPAAHRAWLTREIWLVMGLSLGQSAVYSIVSIISRLTAPTPLGEQSTAINQSLSERTYLDLTYQLLGHFFAIVPVMLALFLLSGRWRLVPDGEGAALAGGSPTREAENGGGAGTATPPSELTHDDAPAPPAGTASPPSSALMGTRRVGFDLTQPGRDFAWGFGLAALIGLPGLAFYLFGRAVGITVQINPAALDPEWWAIPVLIIAALKNAIVEEVLVVGYLAERTRALGWSWWKFSLTSAALRGTYHLYQGVGPWIGNFVMGLVFNEFYRRRGRTMPLVVAHALIDIVAFVGWWLVPQAVRDFLS